MHRHASKNGMGTWRLKCIKRVRGFNLIELLVTASIAATLAGTAAPMLSTMLSKSAVKANSTLLNASLKLARNHAVTTGTNVHLCAISTEQNNQCAERRDFNADWSLGWIVFADQNQNYTLDASDTVLQITRKQGQTKVVFNQRGRLRFFPSGTARSAGFYLCDHSGQELIHLQILHTGRTRSKSGLSQKRKNICLAS